MSDKIKAVSDRTEKILEIFPETRNSDKKLIVKYLKVYHNAKLIDDILDEDVPAMETVFRCRRRIQEEGKYLAEEPVEEARNWNQLEFSDFFSKDKDCL